MTSDAPLYTYLPDNTTHALDVHSSRAVFIFAAACCILFIIVGCLGNLITILALSCCTKTRNATTAFVISLCVADFIFCAVNLPLTASRYLHEAWLLGDTLCTLFPFLFYGNVAVSLLSLTAITVNRLVMINYFHLYEKIYRRPCIAAMVAFCWGFSFLLLLPTLLRRWGKFGYNSATFSCTILAKDGHSPKKFFFVLGFLVPCVAIIVSYGCIYYKVRRSRLNVTAHSPTSPTFPTPQPSQRVDEMRLTCLMLAIFCSFLLCFLPLLVVNVFEDQVSVPTVHVLASVLSWMSACINPVLYAALNRHYRQAYVRLFCPRRKGPLAARSASHSTTSSSLRLSVVPLEVSRKLKQQNSVNV